MLYVQQSLNPNEEIVRIGQFHWWYTFNAALWAAIGAIFMGLILAGGVYWEVIQYLNTLGANVNFITYWNAGYKSSEVVDALGGLLNVIKIMHWGVKLSAFLTFLYGLLIFAQKMVIKATTEICLTTDRLVLKRGMISRHVAEISVDRIEGVDVFQGVLARIMNFGFVAVRGMGVGEIVLPQIEDPVNFRRAIERARSLKKGEDV